MNNDKARFILRSYRASGEDARDPLFAEALDQAGRDPEMHAWFAEQRTVDRAIQAKLASVPVPASLRADILSAANVTAPASFRRRRLAPLAIAAALAVVIGGAMLARIAAQPPLSLTAFPAVAASFVSGRIHLEKVGASLEEASQWMATMPALSDAGIPPNLRELADAGVGCRSFSWRGQDIALLCFRREDGEILHFFVMDARSLPDAAGNEEVRIARHGTWITKTWVEDNLAYVLASSEPMGDAA